MHILSLPEYTILPVAKLKAYNVDDVQGTLKFVE